MYYPNSLINMHRSAVLLSYPRNARTVSQKVILQYYISMELLGNVIDHGIYIFLYLYIAAFIYNYFTTRISIAHPPKMGNVINVNGRKQYIAILGSKKPVVVIEPSIGSSLLEWYNVCDKLSKYARVVVYDRAGYGWSDPGPKPRYGKQIAAELRLLLKQAQIKGPYIFVSQAEGALFAEQFARQYPQEVAAFIAINPVSKDNSVLSKLDVPTFHKAFAQTGTVDKIRVKEAMSRFGIMRLVKKFLKQRYNRVGYKLLPPEVLNAFLETRVFAKTYETEIHETEVMMQTMADIQSSPAFPDVPVTVIHHDPTISVQSMIRQGVSEHDAQRVEALWQQQAKDYLSLSSHSHWNVAKQTSFNIPLTEPEIIVDAVKNTLEEI